MAWQDPWPSYAAPHEHEPVDHVVPEGEPEPTTTCSSRHADVLVAGVDTETFSSPAVEP